MKFLYSILATFVPITFCSCTLQTKQEKIDLDGYTYYTYFISGKVDSVKNSDLVDENKDYIGHIGLIKNDTGRELIRYVVTYNRYGIDRSYPIKGKLIKPNGYMDLVARKFTTIPPTKIPFPDITTYTRSGQTRAKKMQLTEHYVDYAENVRNMVILE